MMEAPSHYVQAVYSFKGTNNDELCFKKGQILSITQREDGGWWEGTLDGKTGWFPSNYVTEYKLSASTVLSAPVESPQSGPGSPNAIPLPIDLAAQQRLYKGVVVKDLLESERIHVAELRTLVVNYLRPLKTADVLNPDEYCKLVGNIEDVLTKYTQLMASLEEGGETGDGLKIGKLFLTTAPALSDCLSTYCANHPFAVALLEIRREALNNFMETRGAQTPGLLVLTAGLSKPFRRLDKYQGLLQEVLRHLSETDSDRGDTQRAIHVYKELAANCSSIRRQKQLQLEVLSGGVRNWEGEDVVSLGDILHMGSVAVGPNHSDRYLVLFPKNLLVLAVSTRMSGFIYQGKLPLSAIQIKSLEDSEVYKNAFEISGPMIETIIAACQTKEDQVKWVDIIQKQSALLPQHTSTPSQIIKEKPNPPQHQIAVSPHHRVTSPISQSNISLQAATSATPPPVRAMSVGATMQNKTHPSPPPHRKGPSGEGALLGGWSLSCLRPKPPLRAGLGLGSQVLDHRASRRKEERSYEEDAQILGVIEAYCLSSKTRHTLNSSLIDSPQVLIAEEEKIIVEEHSGGHTILEEKSLVDTVYALKDQVKGLANHMSSVLKRLDTEEGQRAALQAAINSLIAAKSAPETSSTEGKKDSSVPSTSD